MHTLLSTNSNKSFQATKTIVISFADFYTLCAPFFFILSVPLYHALLILLYGMQVVIVPEMGSE